MGRSEKIRQGDIFWLDDCPPLDDAAPKRRPVIVITPPSQIDAAAIVLVIAASTSILPSEYDRIPLPNLRDEPQTKSGLPRPCWAVPRWYVFVDRTRLRDYVGYLRPQLVRRLVEAFVKRVGKL